MKNKLILILTSALMIFWAGTYQQHLQARGSMTDVRLMDVNRILKSYGFKGGVFDQFSTSVNVLPFKSKLEFGKIENEITLDTAEEFITAAYYSPIELSASAKKSILSELPEGKTGALRLAAMWFFKIAEYPENREKYINAVNLVLKMSKEKHGVSVKLSEARKFYEEAVENYVYDTAYQKLKKHYSKKDIDKIFEPVVKYYQNLGDYNLKVVYREIVKAAHPVFYATRLAIIAESLNAAQSDDYDRANEYNYISLYLNYAISLSAGNTYEKKTYRNIVKISRENIAGKSYLVKHINALDKAWNKYSAGYDEAMNVCFITFKIQDLYDVRTEYFPKHVTDYSPDIDNAR